MSDKKEFYHWIEEAMDLMPSLKGKVIVVITNTETGHTGRYYMSVADMEDEEE